MPVGRSTVKVARRTAAHVYANCTTAHRSGRARGHRGCRVTTIPDGLAGPQRRNPLRRKQLAMWHDTGFWTGHPHRRSARC